MTVSVNREWKSRRELLGILVRKNPGSERLNALYAIECGKREGPDYGLDILSENKMNFREGDYYYYAAGVLEYYSGNYSKAVDCLQEVHLPTLKSEARLYTALSQLKDGEQEEAEEYLKTALDLNPENAAALFQLGLLFYRTDRLAEADQTLEQLLELKRYDREGILLRSHVLIEMGKAYKKRSQVDQAKKCFFGALEHIKRIEKAEKMKDLHLILIYADALKEGEFVPLAIPFYNDLLKRLSEFSDSGKTELLKMSGFFFQKHMLYKRAEAVFLQLNELSGWSNPDHLYWYGGLLYARRRFMEAETVFNKALTMYRENGIQKGEHLVLNSLALIDVGIEDWYSAKEKFEKIIKENPDFWPARAGLADVYFKLKNLEKAELYIEGLERYIPETSFVLVRLRGELEKRKKIRDGITSYRNKKSDS